MARSCLRAIVCGPGTAVLLALGACGGAVDEASDSGALAQPAQEGEPPGEEEVAGQEGGPDPDAAGTGGTRPGAPFDIEVFENIEAEYGGLRASVDAACGTGSEALCTLAEPVVLVGDPADAGGIDLCITESIAYDPPSSVRDDGVEVFRSGATVTASVRCESDEALPEDETG